MRKVLISNRINLFALFLIGATLIISCAKKELHSEEECIFCETYLYGTYTYYGGKQPTFAVDNERTSNYVSFGKSSVFPVTTSDGDRIRVQVPNISIQKDEKSYSIKQITVEEYENGQWDPEFEFQTSKAFQQKNMAIVLVLDMSSSLGNDIFAVKSNAIDFATRFFNETDQKGYVGLVLFSGDTASYPFTNNLTVITNQINNYSNYQNATTLFGSISKGLEMLENTSLAVDGKALIAFTDGGDNNTNNPTQVKQSILNSSIQKYTIGLKGNGVDYDEGTMIQLASTPANYADADNIGELQAAFNDILDQITNIALVNYDRTTQTFNQNTDPPIQVRFKFSIKK